MLGGGIICDRLKAGTTERLIVTFGRSAGVVVVAGLCTMAPDDLSPVFCASVIPVHLPCYRDEVMRP